VKRDGSNVRRDPGQHAANRVHLLTTLSEAAMTIPISYYLILSAIVFLTGVVGVLIRRNIIAILLSVELMLNATNINFVAFSEYLQDMGGQVFVFFALTVAAAEVAVGLAIIIALHRAKDSINIEEFNLLKW
jgi:NADH-quinone oxidoreductase subunit K